MTTAEAAVRGGERTRIWTRALRVVLVVYAIGHLYTGVLFMGWPGWFIAHIGARPPWPFSVTDLGAWPPLHQGFQNVLAAYDLAVAVALLIAARNPMGIRGSSRSRSRCGRCTAASTPTTSSGGRPLPATG